MTQGTLVLLNDVQIAEVRRRWLRDPSFLGFPDAERDESLSEWYDQLLVRPEWFNPATASKATVIIGRKGAGKSAVKLAAMRQRQAGSDAVCIEASADELASVHASKLTEASSRGFGAVNDWMRIFADLIVRRVAQNLSGKLITSDDDIALRTWAKIEGISERDFGERLADVVKTLVPWAQKLASERQELKTVTDERIARITQATGFSLYIDDFDNLQENAGSANIRLIRDAVEAADRITHQNKSAEVHLLMRQDLWLRLRPGWHYADKVAGVVHLNWEQGDLRKWAERRLRRAVAIALGVEASKVRVRFDELWKIFFPEEVVLRNEKESSSFHYLVRRTMYTPRGLRQFIALAIEGCERFPITLADIENAEWTFSSDQLEFLKTEFGGLCEGLDICLQSFTGKPLEWIASDLYRHLRGLLGNGQVRLDKGVSDGEPDVALARFLYRIGFLEVRYPQEERFEVRDVMRYPDHWKSIRKDDAVRWAVRSAFFSALRSHR
ncbi:P-loop ATPase, Sll1717 family [Pseudomonas aeruginosa]|uniref:P-loop ATPase, Sll1717 family n=1 Tax=Pseudomonas aeruginosa TaxID=287 RepID=UPI003F5289B5